MWTTLLDQMAGRMFKTGDLRVNMPDGSTRALGDGTGKTVSITLHDPALPKKIILNPELAIGEAYMDGTLTIEGDDLYGFLEMAIRGNNRGNAIWLQKPINKMRHAKRWLAQFNPVGKAQDNVAHHYDLSGDLYDLFLDEDKQYSCAYFRDPSDTCLLYTSDAADE